MKKIILICILAMLMIPSAFGQLAPTTASLRVTLLRYEPYPVEPGQYFDLWVKLENVGVRKGESVTFEIIPEFPFSLDPNQDALVEIGNLPILEEAIIRFKVRVDEDAVVGKNDLRAKYCTDKRICVTHTFKIDVKSKYPVLAIADVSTNPQEIVPGENVNVKINVNNVAETSMRNIRVKLDLYRKLESATSITYKELPFTPIGSTNEIAIDRIGRGDSHEVIFSLIADPDAELGFYKIPIILTYSDDTGEDYSKEYISAFIVNDKPDMYAIVDECTVCRGGKGIVDIRFINRGITDIKFLDVILESTDDYEVISSERAYIGNLYSDDWEMEEFSIAVNSKEEKIELLLKIEYRDSINKQYKEELIVPLDLRRSKCNDRSSFSPVGILFILILAGTGFFFYRKWRKCKKKKSK